MVADEVITSSISIVLSPRSAATGNPGHSEAATREEVIANRGYAVCQLLTKDSQVPEPD